MSNQKRFLDIARDLKSLNEWTLPYCTVHNVLTALVFIIQPQCVAVPRAFSLYVHLRSLKMHI